MTTTTPAEIHQTITGALTARAKSCRDQAKRHSMSGAHMAPHRKALRGEAARCEQLARILEHVTPEALASVLATGKA